MRPMERPRSDHDVALHSRIHGSEVCHRLPADRWGRTVQDGVAAVPSRPVCRGLWASRSGRACLAELSVRVSRSISGVAEVPSADDTLSIHFRYTFGSLVSGSGRGHMGGWRTWRCLGPVRGVRALAHRPALRPITHII